MNHIAPRSAGPVNHDMQEVFIYTWKLIMSDESAGWHVHSAATPFICTRCVHTQCTMRDRMSLHGWMRMYLHHTYIMAMMQESLPLHLHGVLPHAAGLSPRQSVFFVSSVGSVAHALLACASDAYQDAQWPVSRDLHGQALDVIFMCITSTCGEWTFIVLSQWLRVWHIASDGETLPHSLPRHQTTSLHGQVSRCLQDIPRLSKIIQSTGPC